ARIGAVLQEFARRDAAIRQRRQDIDQLRCAAARAVASGNGRRDPKDDGEPARIVRLARGVAERLEMRVSDRVALEQALEVQDVGRMWLEQVLVPLVELGPAERQAIVGAEAEETDEILTGLDLPARVRQIVEASRRLVGGAQGPGKPDGAATPLTVRVVALVTEYQRLVGDRGPGRTALSPQEALVQLGSESSKFGREVLGALSELVQDQR
ncbi:MAG: HD domain-containing phosphohydrolase, partial [Candidatus Rokuibacteriota bacterium]